MHWKVFSHTYILMMMMVMNDVTFVIPFSNLFIARLLINYDYSYDPLVVVVVIIRYILLLAFC